ncbi:MAG: sodium:alanine symporter family protein [Deltaproteobacteria bacterium]|nr:sodium:alanine symporter family protein [Deltaproteobacteria bacterium]
MPGEQSILEKIINGMNDFVWGWPDVLPLLVLLLVGTGLITTFRLGWLQIRRFGHGVRVVRGDYDDPEHKGDLSHFQALTTALSATVGIGNIAGVATAIHYGGPGALFWMWVTAVFGMALKYTECTLSMRYRTINPDGSAAGGPMYSIERGLGKSWKPLAIAFACFTVISSFGSGNSIQSFTVADQLRQDLSIPTWFSGLVMSVLVAAVILGGVRRIGRVTSKLVPFMALLYVAGGLVVLGLNYDQVIPALQTIVASAFRPAAQLGGFAGGGFIFMLTWGIKRGLFSNESGQGSAPIAHAAAKTDEPVREGMVAMLGPFIDTLVICTMTGLVILTTGVWHDKQEQRLLGDSQAAIQTIVPGARVQANGKLRDKDLSNGRLQIEAGRSTGLQFVYNHGTIDDARILLAQDPLHPSRAELFSGFIEIEGGDLAGAAILDAQGEAVKGVLVIEGRAMQNGSLLTAWAFRKGLGQVAGGYGHLLVTIAVLLFGFSTAISWSYYGDRAVFYLLGERWILPYRIAFCGMVFVGAIFPMELVWAFGDTALGLMTIPNLLSILLLTGVVKRMTKDYEDRGKLQPPEK